MTDHDDLARRFAEVARRASELQDRALDAGDDAADELEAELEELRRQLAELEAEEERLDAGFDLGDDEGIDDPDDAGGRYRVRVDLGDGETREAEGELGDLSELVGDVIDHVRSRITASIPGLVGRARDVVEFDVDHDGDAVEIDNRRGSVRVEAGRPGRIRVHAERHASSQDDLAAIAVDVDPGPTARVTTDWPGRTRRTSVALTVEVPPESLVRVRTGSGSVRVLDVGGQVQARTKSGGSIRIVGARGPADAETAGGSIRVLGHDGPVVASTSGGSIRLRGRLTETVRAETSGGSIRITGVDGATVQGSTSGGSIRFHGRPEGNSMLTTSGGSVRVTLAPDADVAFEAQGTSVSSDLEAVSSTRTSLSGQVGDGSKGTLRVKTSGGSVSITTGDAPTDD